MDHAQQIAALPVRRALDGTPLVLLITSRETRRWVIPKGWPIAGKSSHEAAAIEAWEEAGLKGKVDTLPLGTYVYEKRRRKDTVKVAVSVYLMDVTGESRRWPEHRQRRREWFRAEDAAAAVQEPELGDIIRRAIAALPVTA